MWFNVFFFGGRATICERWKNKAVYRKERIRKFTFNREKKNKAPNQKNNNNKSLLKINKNYKIVQSFFITSAWLTTRENRMHSKTWIWRLKKEKKLPFAAELGQEKAQFWIHFSECMILKKATYLSMAKKFIRLVCPKLDNKWV